MKKILKKFLIIYVIFYITLSSVSSCWARGYDEKCGEYVSNYAREYVEKYASYSNVYDSGVIPAYWSGGSDGSGTFHVCCSTFVQYMFQQALGIDIASSPTSIGMGCNTTFSNFKSSGSTEYVEVITSEAELQPGDILVRSSDYGASSGHMELYIGEGQTANGGAGGTDNLHIGSVGSAWGLGTFGYGLRLTDKVDVNPAGVIPTDSAEDENLSIYDENGFIYSGVAKIEGYKGSSSIGKWIISSILEIIDYLIGILTLATRIVIVGWTAIVERFIVDGIVNAVTGVKNERVDGWQKDPDSLDEIDREVSGEESETPRSEATGEPGDENYISEGVQQIADIGGKVQLNTSSEANVTIENIVYNKIPILDINAFNFESAGGAVVDENGIIYTIKTNVAMWYYLFRVIAIIIMLLVLIYLGIQIAITSATEKKATYKEMLVSWVVGIIIIFTISYALYAIIALNEEFISWVIPKYEDGTEISLYESVRTKAYELKATTGFAGMAMYIILVYYAIRFLLVYFKRYLTVTILFLLSPFIGVAYALEKVNRKGRGASEIFANLMKDFTYSVTLQSVHALIYTIFIQVVLKLTETSIVGIFISFIFLHFMVKMDPIWRKVFGFTAGNNTGKLSIDPLAPKLALATGVGKKAKKYALGYGGFLANHLGGPVVSRTGKTFQSIRNRVAGEINAQAENVEQGDKAKSAKEKEKEEKAKKAARKDLQEQVMTGLSIGKNLALATAKAAIAIPIMTVETNLGIEILSSAMSSREKVLKTIEKAKKDGIIPKATTLGDLLDVKGSLRLKGVRPRNARSARKLASRLDALDIKYEFENSNEQRKNTENSNTRNGKTRNGNREKTTLTPEQRRKVQTQTNINNLRFSSGQKNVSEILEEDGIEKATAYSQILEEARKTEQELEALYEEIVGKIDSEVDGLEGIDPEFIKTLQAKKAKELARMTQILSKPLSEKDIAKAIESYKSKTVTFDSNAEIIAQRDIEGIAKEINSILESRGDDIQMSREFIEKVKKEVADARRKSEQTEKVHVAGVDLTPKAENQRAETGTASGMTQRAGTESTSAGAPKPGAPGSNIQELVKNMKNASNGVDSKVAQSASRKVIQFTKNLEKLQELSQESEEITGEQLYDIGAVLERIKNI